MTPANWYHSKTQHFNKTIMLSSLVKFPPLAALEVVILTTDGAASDENISSISLHWRHNERHGASNHQHIGCLLNHLFRRSQKKTSIPRVNIGSGNGLLPDDTKPSPEPMLWHAPEGNIVWKAQYIHVIKITIVSPRGQWVKWSNIRGSTVWCMMWPAVNHLTFGTVEGYGHIGYHQLSIAVGHGRSIELWWP